MASVDSLLIKGRVKSFDAKTVTFEIAGEHFRFHREKHGKMFTSLKRGETIDISIDRDLVKK